MRCIAWLSLACATRPMRKTCFRRPFYDISYLGKRFPTSLTKRRGFCACASTRASTCKEARGKRRSALFRRATNAQESAIDEAMSALSPEQRTAVHLHYFEGYSTGEIAQMLGLRPATIRSHLRRARIAMKGQLHRAEIKVRQKGQATVPPENESGNKGTAVRPGETRVSPCGGPQPTVAPSEKPYTTFPDLKASPNNGGAR